GRGEDVADGEPDGADEVVAEGADGIDGDGDSGGVEEPHQSIPNLVVKLYCGDDTVGEVLRKNSSAPE
ncbi:hypothetical protein HN873_048073, partial [Arachis hypogaea]